MKKLFFLLFVFITIKGFAQYPVKQRIGGDSTEVWGTMFWGKKGLVNGVYLDTASANLSRISQYPYAQIGVGDTLWMRNSTATAWLKIGSGVAGGPTIIYVKDDLTVDTITNPGFQTLGRLHSDGLESGGILTSAGCMDIQITSASYYLNNGTHYISPATVLTVSAADPADPRKDLVVVDTFGLVSIITGTPSPIPNRPYYNTASQLVINEITVPAGATCLAINTIVIYDETGGTEYTPSTTGTITADPNNTDNPQHFLKAYFISSYADGAKIIFTKPSGQDTVFNNSVFAGFIWLNNSFIGHQIQMQLFFGGVPVTSNISINPYFSQLDTLNYQPLSVPAYAFAASGNIIFDEIRYTLAGNDLSGASGFYLDYLQLQTGINNGVVEIVTLQNAFDNSITAGHTVGSIPTIRSQEQYMWIDSIGTFQITSYGVNRYTNLISDSASIALQQIFGNNVSNVFISDTTVLLFTTDGLVNKNSTIDITPYRIQFRNGTGFDSTITMQANVDSTASVDINNIAYFNADHQLVRGHLASGGGNTIYTADDALVSDRIVDLDGKILTILDGSNVQMVISPVDHHSTFTAYDGIADAGLNAQGNYATNNIFVDIFGDDTFGGDFEILGQIDTLTHTSIIEYTADTHSITGKAIFNSTVRLFGYTVATLPAGVQGDLAFVTDATTPTYNILLVGGGAVVTIAFYNGTNWVAH